MLAGWIGGLQGWLAANPFVTGLLAGLFPALSGVYRMRAWRQTQRELAANRIFSDYLRLAQQYPRQAAPGLFPAEPRSEDWVRYTYFVANMLHSFEAVLRASADDGIWRSALKAHLHYHRRYLATPAFQATIDGYAPRLRALVREQIESLERKPPTVGAPA